MTAQLRPGREIRFVEGFTPHARCQKDTGPVSSWAKITEIALLPSGWIQVDHSDGVRMLYSQNVVASVKDPLVL